MPRVDVTLRGATDASPAPGAISTAATLSTPLVLTAGGGTDITTKMAVPVNSGTIASGQNWPAFRVYNTGSQVTSALSRGATRIALTEASFSPTGGATTATSWRNFLTTFYGNTGTPSLHTNILMDVANGNEEDNKSHNVVSVANTYELMRAVIDDFPNASLWFDATQNQINLGNTPNFMNARATVGSLRRVYETLDGLAGSYYPPHRNDYPNMAANSYTQSNSTPATVVGLFMDLIDSWGPNILTMTAIWEFGIPALITPPPPPFASPGSTVNNATTRPNYVRAMAYEWIDQSLARGLDPVLGVYWDQQSGSPKGGTANTNPDNRMIENDNWFPTFHPTTVETWRAIPADYNASH